MSNIKRVAYQKMIMLETDGEQAVSLKPKEWDKENVEGESG
jgi:hypothetical protein